MSHLLIIHQAFSSLGGTGGTRHFELAQHFIRSGNRVTVVTSNLNYQTAQRERDGEPSNTSSGPTILYASTLNSLHQNFIWRVIGFLGFMISSTITALRVSDVDIVMGTSPPIFQAFSAYIIARLKRCPFLLEIRDLWPDFAIDIGVLKSKPLIYISRKAERFLYKHADHLLVNSPAYVGHITGNRVLDSKVSLIPNGVTPEMFHPADAGNSFREKFALESKFVVTYAGALGLANDIPTIVRAAERLRDDADIVFLFAGDGKERRRLEEHVRELGLQNVVFIGGVAKCEIPEVLAASDVCLATLKNIPMFRMTYPNKVFDYMAAGRPIILAIDGVIREVMERAEAGVYVAPGDHVGIAEAVRLLKNNPATRHGMGSRGRRHVERYFNRADQAAQFQYLIERLVTSAKQETLMKAQ